MAFTTWPRSGFTLARRGDDAEQMTRNYPAQASTNQTISIGDAVTIVNGVVVPATAGQDPAQAGFGIVLNVYTTANRPLTQFANKYIASAGVGRVDVLYDPFMAEYVVRCETSVGPSNINHNVTLVASGANSGGLAQSIQSVTIPASASINDLFRIVRMATFNDIVGINGFNDIGGAGQPVIVRWNNHTFKAGTAGQ